MTVTASASAPGTSDSLALGRRLRADFDRDGYVSVRGFFNLAETAALADRLDRYIREVVPRVPPADAFYEIKGRPETLKQMQRMTEHDSYFVELCHSDRFTKLAEGLLGQPGVSKGVEWFNKPAGVGKPTPPHQDGYYFMLEPNEAVTMWLALDRVDRGNGCIRYVRGSHRRGLRPHGRTETLGFSQGITDYGPADAALEAPMIVEPGDLLVHHSMTIHLADANGSDRERRALGLVYYGENAKQDRAGVDAYLRNLNRELEAKGKI